MKKQPCLNNSEPETGEERLAELIKLAAADARIRKRDAMLMHCNKLQAAITEAMSHWNNNAP